MVPGNDDTEASRCPEVLKLERGNVDGNDANLLVGTATTQDCPDKPYRGQCHDGSGSTPGWQLFGQRIHRIALLSNSVQERRLRLPVSTTMEKNGQN